MVKAAIQSASEVGVEFVERIKILMLRSSNHHGYSMRQMALLEVAYKLYASRVYTLCLRLLANVKAAEEATVQVYVRFSRELWKRWDESRIAARLRDLAINEALSRLRLSANRMKAAVNTQSLRSARFRSSAPALTSETLEHLVGRLAAELRVVFVLHDREGLDYQVISEHLKIKEAEVRRLVRQSRIELRRLRNKTTGDAYEDNYRDGSAVHAE